MRMAIRMHDDNVMRGLFLGNFKNTPVSKTICKTLCDNDLIVIIRETIKLAIKIFSNEQKG